LHPTFRKGLRKRDHWKDVCILSSGGLYVETATNTFETLAVDAKATKADDTTAVRVDAFEMLALDITQRQTMLL
jgi:hypothetical protein